MQHSGRDREGLPWSELYGFGVLKLDAEPTVEDQEELVLILVRVPVKLALHDTEAHQDVSDLDQRLVEPVVGYLIDQGLDVDGLRRFEYRVVMDCVVTL